MSVPVQVIYLLSESFPYERTICDDAGPGYARRHQWPTRPLQALAQVAPHAPVVIDNRLTQDELAAVGEQLPHLSRHPVYFKVVDPHWECLAQPYYQHLARLARLPHVFYVGPYQPTRLTGFLSELAGRDAYVNLPFAYERARELPLATGPREHLLSVSGAADPTYYPERAAILHALRRHWLARWQASILPHPGYPDAGHTLKHRITGDAYIAYLARHRFMYVEPSRDRLEFLKYSECAYAGCVPVGRAPATFEPELASLVLPLESTRLAGDYGALRRRTREQDNDHAREYRARLAEKRDPALLTARLVAHWEGASARLS
jgi:hypothetical protein